MRIQDLIDIYKKWICESTGIDNLGVEDIGEIFSHDFILITHSLNKYDCDYVYKCQKCNLLLEITLVNSYVDIVTNPANASEYNKKLNIDKIFSCDEFKMHQALE